MLILFCTCSVTNSYLCSSPRNLMASLRFFPTWSNVESTIFFDMRVLAGRDLKTLTFYNHHYCFNFTCVTNFIHWTCTCTFKHTDFLQTVQHGGGSSGVMNVVKQMDWHFYSYYLYSFGIKKPRKLFLKITKGQERLPAQCVNK